MIIHTSQIDNSQIPFEPVIINQTKANKTKVSIIRGLLNPEFTIKDIHFINLFSRTSYSHFIEFIYLDSPLKKMFSELECLKATLCVKNLKRQIDSLEIKE